MHARWAQFSLFPALAALLAGCGVDIPVNVGDGGAGNPDPNTPPQAFVGANERNVAVGARVALDATPSSDPDGDALTCRWSQVSGPAAMDIEQAPGNDCECYVVPSVEGVYQFSVIVSDGNGGSDDEAVEVRVGQESWDEGVPSADAGVDQTVNEGSTVTLRGGNSSDPDGDPLEYEWFQLAGPDISLSNRFTAEPTFTAPMVDADAELVFELDVHDGSYGSTDTVVVTVLDRSEPLACQRDSDCDDG